MKTMSEWKNILKEDGKEKAFRKENSESDIRDLFNESLDEQGEIKIGNLTYSPSWVLEQVDSTAYRIGVSEYEDMLLEDFEYEEDE